MSFPFIRRVAVRGLYGDSNLDVELRPGLNIVYGQNGVGKTTLLHVLANLANRDLERFTWLRFDAVVVETSEGRVLELQPLDSETPFVRLLIDGVQVVAVGRDQATPSEVRSRLEGLLGGRSVYLPAFRAVLEAISGATSRDQLSDSHAREFERILGSELELSDAEARLPRASVASRPRFHRDRAVAIAHKTILCRQWFGRFVPVVRFPSLWEVSEQLASEYQQAHLLVADYDREAFTDVFVKALSAVLEDDDDVNASTIDLAQRFAAVTEKLGKLQQEASRLPKAYTQVAALITQQARGNQSGRNLVGRVLSVYDSALASRIDAEREAFQQLRTFEFSVNRFFSGKTLRVAQRSPGPSVRIGGLRPIALDNGLATTFNVLSSGERHVLTLLFSATHMSAAEGMLLIDEPELSMHVDWQRTILSELSRQAGERQVVVCTHAPEITANHRDCMVRLSAVRHSAIPAPSQA